MILRFFSAANAASSNKRHNRRGFFWGDRFKSVIVENGDTLINCLAYIDLNPVRAGMVKRPEDYRDLLVRVAGYSAHFVDLTEGLQDHIIARTEQTL